MKNLFAVYDKKGDEYERFVVKRVSPDKSSLLDEAAELSESFDKSSAPSDWMVMTFIPALAIGLALILSYAFYNKSGGALRLGWLTLTLGVAFMVYGAVCRVFIYLKRRKAAKDPERERLIERIKRISDSCKKELGVPADAKDVDVIMPYIKVGKDGSQKPAPAGGFKYINYPFSVYSDEESVFFADSSQVIAIKKSWFTAAEDVDDPVRLPQWNKDKPYNSDDYLPYGIMPASGGAIVVKSTYRLTFDCGDDQFEVILPDYDKDAFLSAGGIEKQEGDRKSE
ncbi:MAG: hypothetical protein ILP02_02755 [Clostridia bacterium]|nr:hypothetical protein [Clostridia bacterium]